MKKNKLGKTVKRKNINYKKIKQLKFILQYDFKFPNFLRSVETIIFAATK